LNCPKKQSAGENAYAVQAAMPMMGMLVPNASEQQPKTQALQPSALENTPMHEVSLCAIFSHYSNTR
jgi:hypothetical protein